MGAAEVAVNQLVVNQQAVSQPETNPLSAVMTENGPNVKNQLPSKMDVSSVKRINACSNVTKVSWLMAVVKQNASRVKTEKLSLSIRHSEHVIHAQKMVAQNHQNHPVVSQLVINQLVKSHQQASARTSLLCSGKTLSLLLNVLKMTLVKWPVILAAQKELCSWVRKAKLVPVLSANAKDQNVNGPTQKRRPSTVK